MISTTAGLPPAIRISSGITWSLTPFNQTLKPLEPAKQALVDKILQRLDGVLQVRESKYIMLNAPKDALERISALLPGSEAPTVVPLEGSTDRVAVHAVCTENVFWATLENLKAAGATSLLVLPIEKMLA